MPFLAGIDRTAAGRLQATEVATVALHVNGYPIDGPLGLLCTDSSGAIDHYLDGIPRTAEGKVALNSVGAATHYQNGLPITAGGRVAFETEDPVRMSNGWPLTAAGKLSTT